MRKLQDSMDDEGEDPVEAAIWEAAIRTLKFGHQLPWIGGKRPLSSNPLKVMNLDDYSLKDRKALDDDLKMGLLQNVYQDINEDQVVMSAKRKVVWQHGGTKARVVDPVLWVNKRLITEETSVSYEGSSTVACIATNWVSKLDLEHGYWQVLIEEKDRPYLCFSWRGKWYCFRVLPVTS